MHTGSRAEPRAMALERSPPPLAVLVYSPKHRLCPSRCARYRWGCARSVRRAAWLWRACCREQPRPSSRGWAARRRPWCSTCPSTLDGGWARRYVHNGACPCHSSTIDRVSTTSLIELALSRPAGGGGQAAACPLPLETTEAHWPPAPLWVRPLWVWRGAFPLRSTAWEPLGPRRPGAWAGAVPPDLAHSQHPQAEEAPHPNQ